MQRRHPIPPSVYALVDQTPGAILLESASSSGAVAYSRLFLSPSHTLTAHDGPSLDRLFERVESALENGEFAAGYFAYECGNCFEPSAGLWPAAADQPLAWLGIYARCHLFDHAAGAFVHGSPDELIPTQSATVADHAQVIDARAALAGAEYAERIEAIHELIRAGDVYQVNFTFPTRFEIEGSAAELYATLRGRQPVDYGAFLHCNASRKILSFSPELFFRVDGQPGARRIVTRPMKGTAPRGRTTAEDRDRAEWLRQDAKNRSENVMIVDLLRNDVGRLCEYGSVRVSDLFAVERHPSLWQMTSTVTGDLRPAVTCRDIFRALFPSGSVTGAPKVRAMQLLAKLEGCPRGVYTGAIGYFSRAQSVFNVAIRTIELDGMHGRMGIGSGIVIDSVAADEYRECALKAQFLTATSEPFLLIETILWDGRFPLLELHLDRLEDSADYFDFACEREAVKASLLRATEGFDCASRRVRLTLAIDGSLQIEQQALSAQPDSSACLRVRIAEERTNATDRFLFHKTTNRALYISEFDAAKRAGYEDVLFLNREEQVTEGAVSNIFIERDGRWFTPPIECGVLPGVYRRYLLETRPDIEQRIITLDDLKAADGVYLSNAVRGLRRVVIDGENISASRTSA